MADQFLASDWLVSCFASLTDYINGEIDNAIKNDVNGNAGLQVYKLVMDFPTSEEVPENAQLEKTVIHLAIDDIDNRRLGFGESFVKAEIVEPTVPDAGTITNHEAQWHEINFDVGVWASDESGGSSSRLRAYQMLHSILGTEEAKRRCFDTTGGIEIRRFNNGRFIIEKPNDIRLFRIVGAELVIRVASDHVAAAVEIVDEEPIQQQDVEIGEVPIVS